MPPDKPHQHYREPQFRDDFAIDEVTQSLWPPQAPLLRRRRRIDRAGSITIDDGRFTLRGYGGNIILEAAADAVRAERLTGRLDASEAAQIWIGEKSYIILPPLRQARGASAKSRRARVDRFLTELGAAGGGVGKP